MDQTEIAAKLAYMADNIRKDIVTWKLYGEPVNMDDPNAVLVAAYYLGESKQRNLSIEHAEFLDRLYGR